MKSLGLLFALVLLYAFGYGLAGHLGAAACAGLYLFAGIAYTLGRRAR